jgi:hypothetical protein
MELVPDDTQIATDIPLSGSKRLHFAVTFSHKYALLYTEGIVWWPLLTLRMPSTPALDAQRYCACAVCRLSTRSDTAQAILNTVA